MNIIIFYKHTFPNNPGPCIAHIAQKEHGTDEGDGRRLNANACA